MHLSMKQTQDLNLVMTVQLRQAIELLQYSTQELAQFIQEQELNNPLIELKEPTFNDYTKKKTVVRPSQQSHLLEQMTADQKNIRDELLEQVTFMFSNAGDIKLLQHIIYHLDDNGYYEPPIQPLYCEQTIEHGIHLLQAVGPTGIGARNLKECLLLQTIYCTDCPPLTDLVITHHLDAFANKQWKKITQALNISLCHVQKIADFILTLQPKFSFLFLQESAQLIIPDIIVELIDDRITFSLNDFYLPKITLHADYVPYIQQNTPDKGYFKKHFSHYQWLTNSIEQRRRTLIKVMTTLLQKQQDFFRYGMEAIQPLTLREVAEDIDVHESTVSRITTNKYVQTPFGTFELRALFTSKLQTSSGGSISQIKVKALLTEYIQSENKSKPFSDQKIADHLHNALGIEISRRTISKYREELKIPSSSQRKVIVYE